VRNIIVLFFTALITPSGALAQPIASPERTDDFRYSVCQIIETAAQEHKIPVDFFTRVIWQESRFRADVVGPLTRTGERAQGIAQFMPGTAAERDLHEPFNPSEALPKSAEFLAELRAQFGNLGLAAAAYNAGPQRVRDFLVGSRDLPVETRNYVFAITGHPIEEWKVMVVQGPGAADPNDRRADAPAVKCRDVLAQLERASNSFVVGWQQRNVPSWCRGLHHPDVNVCGAVHLAALEIKSAGAVSQRSHVHLPSRRQVSTSVSYQKK
jgi:Transglycosylase SLT domain